MRNCVFIFLFSFAIISCKENKESRPLPLSSNVLLKEMFENSLKDSTYLDKLLESFLLVDTLIVKKSGGEFCFNYDLDSLCNEEDDLFTFNLIDIKNNKLLIPYNFFVGSIGIDKIAEKKYEFVISSYFPNYKNLNLPFIKHQMLKYSLEFFENEYRLIKYLDIKPKLTYSEKELIKARDYIENHKICTSENWDEAADCLNTIQKHESLLFTSVINGSDTYKSELLNLRNSISLINAGANSEDYEGDMILLIYLNKIKISEYPYSNNYESYRDIKIACYE
jgi:hypothetical protein